MLLVVGLGNPGKKYEGNRHNVGFAVADSLRRRAGLPDWREKFSGVWARGDAFTLLKPMTFMNLSGDSVQAASAFLKIPPSDVVVIHDELELPFGEVQLKMGGGHTGHNGVRSTMQRLGTPDFARVRVGIGRPPRGFRGTVADYVLLDFDPMERAELQGVLDRALVVVDAVVKQGVAAAMNSMKGLRTSTVSLGKSASAPVDDARTTGSMLPTKPAADRGIESVPRSTRPRRS